MADRLDNVGLAHLIGRMPEVIGSFAVETGAITSLPKQILDSRIGADCIVENDYIFSDMDLGCVTTAGKVILYGSLPTGVTKPNTQLVIRRVQGLTADAPEVTLELQTSSSTGGSYLVARARNLLPGVQYSFSLYKVVSGGTDQYMYGIGSVTGWPTWSYWFQEVARGLEDGESYYVKLSQSGVSGYLATSNTVEFEGGDNVPAS
jgi:hypothetical protein